VPTYIPGTSGLKAKNGGQGENSSLGIAEKKEVDPPNTSEERAAERERGDQGPPKRRKGKDFNPKGAK